jgi:hypothetical protein
MRNRNRNKIPITTKRSGEYLTHEEIVYYTELLEDFKRLQDRIYLHIDHEHKNSSTCCVRILYDMLSDMFKDRRTLDR